MEIRTGQLARQQAHGGFERGAFQICTFEIHADQTGFLKIGANEAGVTQIGEQQVGGFEVRVLQICVAQIDADQLAIFELDILQIGFAAGCAVRIEPLFVIREGFFERPFAGIYFRGAWRRAGGREFGICYDVFLGLGQRHCDWADVCVRVRVGVRAGVRVGVRARVRVCFRSGLRNDVGDCVRVRGQIGERVRNVGVGERRFWLRDACLGVDERRFRRRRSRLRGLLVE